MKNYKFTINGNPYDVEVFGTEGSMTRIGVNGKVYDVLMQSETPKVKSNVPVSSLQQRQARISKQPAENTPGQATEIKAPLPGVIVQLLVKPGEEVSPGQTLCTLETMKMENAIKAETGGKVTAVNISAGKSVVQDEVLIVIG